MPLPAKASDEQLQRWHDRREVVGARIRELRLERGLTQEAVALEAGMDRKTIIYLEWGQKSLGFERLWDIASVLGVDVTELLLPPTTRPERTVYRGGRHRHKDRIPDPPAETEQQ